MCSLPSEYPFMNSVSHSRHGGGYVPSGSSQPSMNAVGMKPPPRKPSGEIIERPDTLESQKKELSKRTVWSQVTYIFGGWINVLLRLTLMTSHPNE